MENNKPRIKNQPNNLKELQRIQTEKLETNAETPMAIMIPILPDIAALCVSSVICRPLRLLEQVQRRKARTCALASNPVCVHIIRAEL